MTRLLAAALAISLLAAGAASADPMDHGHHRHGWSHGHRGWGHHRDHHRHFERHDHEDDGHRGR